MKKVIFLISAAFAMITLGACNTVQGIGKDIEKGGEALQRSAK